MSHLCVPFGVGKHFRYIKFDDIDQSLGPDKSYALPMFYTLMSCNTTCFFSGKRKTCMWDTWMVYPDLAVALVSLSSQPQSVSDEAMAIIERFVLVYDQTSNLTSMNPARQFLYC